MAGLTQAAFADHARVSFAKVAEFQRRGAVHFHAIVRIDGPDGPDSPPPSWATVQMLDDAIRAAAAKVRVELDPAGSFPARTLAWGEQVDVRPITSDLGGDLTEQAVAAYVAKYATKAAETTGTVDSRLIERAEVDKLVPRQAMLALLTTARRRWSSAWRFRQMM